MKVGDLVHHRFGSKEILGIVLEMIPVDRMASYGTLTPPKFTMKILDQHGGVYNYDEYDGYGTTVVISEL